MYHRKKNFVPFIVEKILPWYAIGRQLSIYAQEFKIMLNLTEEPLHQQLDILWEPAEDGARILRVYGEQPALRLPEYIGQRPVTEIGPYCFSRSEPKLPEQYFHFYTDRKPDRAPCPTDRGRQNIRSGI